LSHQAAVKISVTSEDKNVGRQEKKAKAAAFALKD